LGSAMYLIIDNNVTHVIVDPSQPDAAAILQWLHRGGRAVTGGKLLREYTDPRVLNGKFVSLLRQLSAAGQFIIWDCEEVDLRESVLTKTANLHSNDAHIIALAQVSGARALWSLDADLRRDFSSKELIDRPRGRFFLPSGSERRRTAGIRAISTVCGVG
jgi:predicted nucleic acid-binding protein